MGWDTQRFWPAFKRSGMLHSAECTRGAHNGETIDVDFREDTGIDDQLAMTTSGTLFEYETSDASNIAINDLFVIAGTTYRVVNPPRLIQNGDFSQVDLVDQS